MANLTRPRDKSAKFNLTFLSYVVGTQKNHLNEMVLLSTQNKMLKLMEEEEENILKFTLKVLPIWTYVSD